MTWPSRFAGLVLLLALAAGRLPAEDPVAAPRGLAGVDYLREIQPIFDAHCVECHGPKQASYNLRLHNPAAARQGGASGKPITGGTLETNETWRRVSSDDAAFRMPKGHAPLSSREIETLRRWVTEGGPVPMVTALSPPPAESAGDVWVRRSILVDQWLKRNPYVSAFQYVGLVLLILTLAVRRTSWKRRIRGEHLAIFWIVFSAGFLILQQKGTADAERQRADDLQTRLQEFQPTLFDRFGFPPVPTRLTHPRALSRTYYRGNCERDEKLFNFGNYCTNTFVVRLQAGDGKELHYQDALPAQGLTLHFEILRSPGTTSLLYEDDQMTKSVWITPGTNDDRLWDTEHAVHLAVVTSGEAWAVDLPITDYPQESGQITRRYYLSLDVPSYTETTSTLSYSFQLELLVQDGKIAAGSDVWMGCLNTSPNVLPAENRKLPFCEWFDWRPLPVISGENTTDLKLLGVLDHRPELQGKPVRVTEPAESLNQPPPPDFPTDP